MSAKRVVIGATFGLVGGVVVANRRQVEAEFTHPHKLLSQLQHNSQFTRVQGDQNFSQVKAVPGVLSEEGGLLSPLAFVSKSEPGKSVTFVYAGSRTVGFPFVVHGGILGTLLERSYKLAGTEPRKLHIEYKSPTFCNQFLVVTTTNSVAEIRTLDGKLLVQATSS